MSSESTYGGPSGANNSTIEYAENALIAGVAGKKVFVVDSSGNQVDPATSAKQDTQTTILNGIAGFTVTGYDYIALTYVAAGNGTGEIETVTFKTGGSGGTPLQPFKYLNKTEQQMF